MKERLVANQYRVLFYLILCLFVILASISSVVVPPFETPDEIWHFAFIQQLASGGGLPVSEPQTTALWRQQGVQAPAYYMAAAALTFWIDQSDFPALYERTNPHVALGGGPDMPNRTYFLHYPTDGWPWQGSFLALHVARFFSVFLAAITLWATYQTLLLLVQPHIALLGVTLLAFIPQFVFISGAASNDNAINATASLLLWRLVLLLKSSLEEQKMRHPYIQIGLLLGLALLSKVSGLSLLLLTLGTLLWMAYRTGLWRLFAQNGLIVVAIAFLLSGWWFIRNGWLYGDLLASNIWLANILLRDEPATWRTLVYSEWESLDHSFWGLFGWFNVAYPTWLYRLLQLLEVSIVAGLLLRGFRWAVGHLPSTSSVASRSTSQKNWPLPGIMLLCCWLLMITISWLGFFRIAPAAQGRYFHPAAPTLALGMAIGLRSWRLKATHRPFLAWGVALFLFVLSVITPWWTIYPAYQPSTVLTTLPEGVTPLNINFGEMMRLEGYTVTPRQIAPSTPMDLTLYWRVLQPMDDLYSVAIKGFGRAHNGELIARDDSYPDAGRWPTTLWEPGQVIADRWRIWISGQTLTPTVARLKVDVYQLGAENGQIINRLPAKIDDQSVSLPVEFAELIVREANSQPTTSADFAFRPITQALALEKGEAEQVVLDFAWQVGEPLPQTYHAFFHLAPNVEEPPIAQNDFAPIENVFPTQYWQPGDELADQVRFSLPKDATPGTYQLLLGLYDLNSGQRVIGEGSQHTWVVGALYWDGEAWGLEE